MYRSKFSRLASGSWSRQNSGHRAVINPLLLYNGGRCLRLAPSRFDRNLKERPQNGTHVSSWIANGQPAFSIGQNPRRDSGANAIVISGESQCEDANRYDRAVAGAFPPAVGASADPFLRDLCVEFCGVGISPLPSKRCSGSTNRRAATRLPSPYCQSSLIPPKAT